MIITFLNTTDCIITSTQNYFAVLLVARGVVHCSLWFGSVPEVETKIRHLRAELSLWWRNRETKKRETSVRLSDEDSIRQSRERLLERQQSDLELNQKHDDEETVLVIEEAEWFLRAEVVKLTSHGIPFNSLAHEAL